MMAAVCFCGMEFASVERLYQHASSRGHRIQCSCGELFGTHKHRITHQRTVEHDVPLNYTVHAALKGLPGTALVTQPQNITMSRSSMQGNTTQNQSITEVHQGIFHCKACNNKSFNSDEALQQHTAVKHSYTCDTCPGKMFVTELDLEERFANENPACPSCSRVFGHGCGKKARSARERLHAHQRGTGHCYCDEHEIAFSSHKQLKKHNRETIHTTSFECIDCDREFSSHKALHDHLAAKIHIRSDLDTLQAEKSAAVLAMIEEANLHCQTCDRTFGSLVSFYQHKASVKHKPLSDLYCPFSTGCEQHFTSPSALLFHLESGTCESGMNRLELNDLVYQHDFNHQITQEGLGALGSASREAGKPVVWTKVGLEDDMMHLSISQPEHEVSFSRAESVTDSEDSESSGVLPIPSASPVRSRASSGSGVLLTPAHSTDNFSERSCVADNKTLTSPTGSFDNPVTRGWPCGICDKTFRKEGHLVSHLNSPAHAPKIFHCPTALLGLSSSKTISRFKTLSGLAQHIEAGACAGGQDMLKSIVDIFEDKIKTATGNDVRLLCNSV